MVPERDRISQLDSPPQNLVGRSSGLFERPLLVLFRRHLNAGAHTTGVGLVVTLVTHPRAKVFDHTITFAAHSVIRAG